MKHDYISDTTPYTKHNEEQSELTKELVQDNAYCNKCHLDSCSLSWQFLLSFEATFLLLFPAYSTSVPFYDMMLTLKYATICLMAIDAKFFLFVMHFSCNVSICNFTTIFSVMKCTFVQ